MKENNPSAAGGTLWEYINAFERLQSQAQVRLKAAGDWASTGNSSAWEGEVSALEKVLDEMEANRRQVQVQVRLGLSGITGEEKKTWDERLEEWHRKISSLRESMQNAKEDHSRRQLRLGGSYGMAVDCFGSGAAERIRVEHATDLENQSLRRLEEARRTAIETESLSHGILNDLSGQRETIQHARDNMGLVSSELDSARRSIDHLLRHAMQNQIIMMAVSLILGFVITFWLLMILGLELKWNLLLAALVVMSAALGLYLRRRFMLKKVFARQALG